MQSKLLMTMNNRVFLLEPLRNLNVASAQQFGNVQYILPEDCERTSIWRTEEFARQIIDKLYSLHYVPSEDYIAVTGQIVPLAIMIAAIANEWGCFRALLFSATDHSYVERMLG